MTSWTEPTPEDVAQTVAHLAQQGHYRHFFNSLKNPLWVRPLRAHYFKEPPDVDRSSGGLAFPDWPELTYLLRMAEHPVALDEIAEIVDALPDTENEWVRSQVLRLVTDHVPQCAQRLIPRVRSWVEGPIYVDLHERVCAFCLHLVSTGQQKAGLRILYTLLKPSVGPRTELIGALSRPNLTDWDYRELVHRAVPALVDVAALDALDMWMNLLEQALHLSFESGRDAREDHSVTWRRTIPDDSRSPDIRDALVSGLRDYALGLAQGGAVPVVDVVDALVGHRWSIFRRLALWLAAETGDAPAARSLVLDEGHFSDSYLFPEYGRLLKRTYPELDAAAREQVLAWIDAGPPASEQELFEPEVRERRASRWRRDRLALLRKALGEDRLAELASIEAKFGSAQPPAPLVGRTRAYWRSSSTPLADANAAGLPVQEVVVFLTGYQPGPGLEDARREDVGRELTAIVGDHAARYALDAELFVGQDPTYVRALLTGLRDGLKKGADVSWPPVLSLVGWAMAQPRGSADADRPWRDRDPHWGWARRAVVELIEDGLRKDGPPLDRRKEVWSAIEHALADPDPSPDSEKTFAGGESDPVTMALNFVRSAAMDTAIQYGLWLRRHLGEDAFSLGETPELRTALERHLDPELDPSLAVRSIYGQQFPWLQLLDRSWAADHLDRIFPRDPASADLFDAAWTSYVTTCELYRDPLSVLRPVYLHAIDGLDPDTTRTSTWFRDPDERVAEHVMVAYGRGYETLNAGSLVERFFTAAPHRLRLRALEFAGRSVSGEAEVPDDVLQRFRSLWGAMTGALSQPGAVVAGFSSWFASARFDEAWSLEQLELVLDASGGKIEDRGVIERLAELADRHAGPAVRCLRALIRGQEGGWRLHAWRAQIRSILSVALKQGETQLDARDLINRLGQRGFIEYRDLLDG